ncbi:MAG TPA: radical SAM/SPASM domain-containing protein [Candidatus Bathyarchaeia archaeon]|nr:radical SAM/SPASM domain-containing protein [Candidatus Bathyarchaeia archaeon]
MKATDISGQAPGGKRTRLAAVLPLATPFVVQIFPIYACNFKCNYCIFHLDKNKRGFISDKVVMDLGLYKKCVDDMAKFPNKIKVVRFVGIGEPLLHPNIAEMVAYTASKKIARTVEMLTNASLLTPKMSDSLISAGLTRLVVSLQGTTKEKYKEVCQTDIDFEEFVKNLRYFFENKGDTQMYIKIIDCALQGKDDEKKFYKIFGDLCDTIAIEHMVPIHSNVDYEKIIKGKKMSFTQFGLPVSEVKICPQPFFHFQINPDGKIVPCYSFEYPEILGDCHEESVVKIWNGKKFQSFRRRMLDGVSQMPKICPNCDLIKYRLFPEDVLNDDAERLKKFYET